MTMTRQFILSGSIWNADISDQIQFSSNFSYDSCALGSEAVWIDRQEEGFLRLHAIFPHGTEYMVAQHLYLSTQNPYSSYSIQFDNLTPDVGYIYLMEAVGSPRVKIGYSEDPIRRNRQLSRCQAPYPIEILHTAHCRQMSQAEGFLKRAFADKQVHGEWFELEQRDVEIVRSLRFI